MLRKIYKKTSTTTTLMPKLLFLFCSIFLAASFFSENIYSQCLSGSQYPFSTFNPTCGSGTQLIVSDGWAGEYSTVSVVAGNTYTFISGTTNSFITIGNSTGTLAYTFGTTPVAWTSTITGNIRFYTHTNSSCGTNFSDDIRSVSCTSTGCSGAPTPGNTISSVTGACLGTPFTLSLQNATAGSGVSYVWQSADNPAFTVNLTTLSSTSATQTIASQTASKYYHCWVTCSGNTTISTPVYVPQNAPSACYCIPISATGCNDGDVIARVVLNTLDNNSGTGCPSGVGGNGYSDYTATGIATNTTSLIAGNSYNCQVWAGQYDGNYAAWIDYNDDGVFATNERIGYTTTTVLGSNIVGVLGSSAIFPITLSCNPTPGPHRLRVREVYGTTGSAITPCGSATYSETEDYIVTVLPPLPCPSPSSFASNTPTVNGATFTWNAGCVETDWVIEFGLPGFTAGTGTSVMATNDTTVVNTMNCGTNYDVYLRANCLTNGYSTYVGPISVTTLACPCIGNPASSNALASVASACPNTPFTLSLDNTYSTVTGITYQWESSPAGAATWNPISGATTSTYPLTSGVSVATDFRCVITCSASTLSTNSNPVSVGILATPVGNTIIDPIIMTFIANTYSNTNNTANCFTSTYTGANAQASPDVYYQFVAPACTDSAVISVCGAGWDTYLHLLDNTGTQIANNDDGCSSASIMNVGGLVAGQTYYVVVEGWSNNTGAYTLSVNLFDNPLIASATVSPSDIECEGTSMTFNGAVTGTGVGFTYNWSGPAPVTNATAFNVTFAHSGNYTMTVTDANGCTATTTLPILILQAPPITASGTTPICIGSSTTLVGGGAGMGGSYVWDNGVIDNVAFTPVTSGTTIYQVTGTDGYGCTATASVSVLVNNPANFNVPITLTNTCPTNTGGSVIVTATIPSTFTISPAGPTQPSLGVFTSMVGGTNYIVTLTDANSCTNTTMISATSPSNGELAYATAGNASSLPGNICGNMQQSDGSTLNYYGASCDDLIATVNDGSGGNVLGNVNACVTVLPSVPVYNSQPYLPRMFDITPTNQGPATIMLYFTQDDFNDYNAAAGSFPQIPASPIVGTAAFSISQVPGGFLPGSSGATTIVHNVTATWNAAFNRWEVSLPVSSFSGFYAHATNPLNAALPAAIANFKGIKTENSDVLTWTTTSELNNAAFTVLYSNDGKNYTPLTTVNSKATSGNSNVELSYSAENKQPKLGHNYYKLEQIDMDGKSLMNTQVVDLMWGATASTINVYPNPTSNELNIDIFTTKAENSTIKILDMSGRILKEIQTKLSAGANSIQTNIGELATGIYTLQIFENNKITQVSKIEKK